MHQMSEVGNLESEEYNNAVFTLLDGSSDVNERLRALRYLYQVIQDGIIIDPFNRKKINQLILDNVMRIMLDEASSSNSFKQQLIRVELFTLLSHILRAENLFGNDVTQALQRHAETLLQRSESPQNEFTVPEIAQSKPPKSSSRPWLSSSSSSNSSLASSENLKSPIFGRARLKKKPAVKTLSSSNSVGSITSDGLIASQSVVKDVLSLMPKQKLELSSKMKPRAAVLFNETVAKESFVPGVDPTNFLEQDRKLGYQKPRMWFPKAMMAISKEGVDSLATKSTGSSQVVEEYLRMRALATYVGDAVVPFSGRFSKYLPSTSIISPSMISESGKSAPIDAHRYKNAVKEVMDMWTPILFAHKPVKGKRPHFSYLRSQQDVDVPSVKERKVFEEYVPFEDDDDKYTSTSMKLHYLSREEIMEDLKDRKEKLNSSISSITNRIHNYMDKAYQRFQTRYLLVLEGNQADARKKLITMTKIFLKHKRRNLLILAFGLLKVPMVEAALKSKTPQYKRVAACNLILGWLKRARRKNFQRWLSRWVYITGCIVFTERNKAAARIQTLARRSRDRRKFMLMHKSKPYLGPLSDIRLGPYRPNTRYKIPRYIRIERRMYWLAATLIQTCFRSWFESKDYFLKKRRIVLLQSICRMWPKYRHYQRLKRATVRTQSWARRSLWRGQYLQLKAAALIAQKYVRRYLCILFKLEILDTLWEEIEEEKWAVIKIQKRVRIHHSKRRTKGKRMYKRMLQWGALVIQRNWYRKKRAFHTFFLMCALRERESQDIALEKLATKMGRYQCARRIQRLYRLRFWQRVISNVIRVQCWYRGRLGFRNAEKLRKQKWACRKLHFWAKGLLKRRHVLARRIQSWWWRLKKRRLLKHLWVLQKLRDQRRRYKIAERRHNAALRIQAIVKGVWDRRFVKRTRAASLIQKNWRFLHGLKKWKRMKKDHIMRGVQRAVANFIDKGLKIRVTAVVKHHIVLITKVQALVRRFVVRSIFRRARQYANKLAPAVITIQRFWRKSGMLLQAVEEVLARRRIEANPFKFCMCLHDVMQTLRKELKTLYSLRDPRIGMRVSDFLYRLGYYEYLELFPKRDFKNVTELQSLTMDKITELYTMAQNRKRANAKDNNRSKRNNANNEEELVKKRKIPVQDLQNILNVVNIPLYPRKKKDIAILNTILSFPEYCTPQEAIESIRSYFLKKFGRHLQARATNVATEIVENAFFEYNTFRSFAQPVTKAQLIRALTDAPESASVMSTLEQIRALNNAGNNNQVDEWLKVDVDRMKQTLGTVQMAYDRAFDLLPEGSILTRFEKTVGKSAAFKRKADYLKKKAEQVQRAQRLKAAKQQQGKGKLTAAATETEATENTAEKSGVEENKSLTEEQLVQSLTPSDCVEVPYHGPDKFLDLEYYASSARLYLDTIEQYFGLSLSIQSLKNTWYNKAMRRAMQAEKRKVFLEEVTSSYIAEQHANKVHEIWDKLRKREVAQKIYNNIIMAARGRKFQVEAVLAYIPRCHVQTFNDDPSGYPYYVDERGNATYEMPIYSFVQHLAVVKIQQVARAYIEQSLIRRMQKEEEERELIREMEEAMRRQQLEALRACSVELRSMFDKRELNSNSVSQLLSFIRSSADENKKKNNVTGKKETKIVSNSVQKTLEQELEELLPWKYRFVSPPKLIPGMWALYIPPKLGQSSSKSSPLTFDNFLVRRKQMQETFVYEIVIVFKIRLKEGLCDIRNFKGIITKDVPLKRLRHLSYDVGFPVECRYKYRKLFYRAKVHHVNEFSKQLEPLYDVTYEDGEKEFGLGRDAIRPNSAYLLEWFSEREKLLKELFLVRRRQDNFSALRKDRMRLFHERLKTFAAMKQNGLLPGAKNKGGKQVDNPLIENSRDERNEEDIDNEDSLTANSLAEEEDDDDDDVSVLSMEEENDLEEGEDASTVAPAYKSPKDKTKKRRKKRISDEEVKTEPNFDDKNEKTAVSPSFSKKQEKLLLSFYADHHEGGNENQATLMDLESKGTRQQRLSMLDPTGPAMIKVKLRVTRRALLMGWQIISPPNSAEPVYYHPGRDEQRNHAEAPFYNATEIHMVHRIQARWFLHKAFLRIQSYVSAINISDYVTHILQRGSKMAFVGYKFEGLTCLQMLIRAGYWEVAEAIQEYYRDLRKSIWQLSIEEIATKRHEEFDRIGVMQSNHIRDLKEFQSWWKKTLPYERENKLVLINYYSSPEDTRSIHQCIQDSNALLFKKFSKGIKTSTSKTKRVLDSLLAETNFPFTHAQIECFLKKYADHPDQARDAMSAELTDRATCNTQVEEIKVYELYRHCARRVAVLMGIYKLKRIRSFIRHKLKFADDIVKLRNLVEPAAPAETKSAAVATSDNPSTSTATAAHSNTKTAGKPSKEPEKDVSETMPRIREKSKSGPSNQFSGPEAKAAWLLRSEVLQYFLDLSAAAYKIQRHVKRYLKAKNFKALLLRRRHALDVLQRCSRRYLAYKKAKFLRMQQSSPWEQLWHSDYNALYYYNYINGQSTYEEPPEDVSYRPLVRHPVSAALMQAWPMLDEARKAYFQKDPILALTNGTSSKHAMELSRTVIIPPNALCNVCDKRLGVKLCLDCLRHVPNTDPYATQSSTVTKPTNYCLPCYAKAHPADQEEIRGPHRFVVVTPHSGSSMDASANTVPNNENEDKGPPYLHCCICNEPATRKCQGLYSDAYVDLLCERLKKATLADWRQVVLDCSISPASNTAPVVNKLEGESSMKSSSKRSPRKTTLQNELDPGYLSQQKFDSADMSTSMKGSGGNDDLTNGLQDERGSGGEDKSRLISLIEDILSQTNELPDPLHDPANNPSTGGEKKTLSMSAVFSSAVDALAINNDSLEMQKYSALSPVQLQSIRSLFTKLRAECDECYCQPCYDQLHGRGKRTLHIWKGFQAKVHICTVCQSSPVENDCIDCSAEYCEPCFRVFHTKGQKRKHKHQHCREVIRNKKQESYCSLCQYRVGHSCPRGAPCTTVLCDECAEFKHTRTLHCAVTKQELQTRRLEKYERQQQRLLELQKQEERAREDAEIAAGVRDPRTRQLFAKPAQASNAKNGTSPTRGGRALSPSAGGGSASDGAGTSPSPTASRARTPSSPPRLPSNLPPPPPACTICGEDADKICVECGDYYCSRTWMGNPGCFIQVHTRGNRASHTTEPLSKAKMILLQRQQQRLYHQKPMASTQGSSSAAAPSTLLSRTAPVGKFGK